MCLSFMSEMIRRKYTNHLFPYASVMSSLWTLANARLCVFIEIGVIKYFYENSITSFKYRTFSLPTVSKDKSHASAIRELVARAHLS